MNNASTKKTVAAKPVTTFNKQYVKDRIAARRASLESKIRSANGQEAQFWQAEKQAAEAWLVDVRNKMAAVEAWAANNEFKDSDTIRQLEVLVEQIPRRGRVDYNIRNAHEDLTREVRRAKSELTQLDHASAYFDESPVEEYSITALQKLGLLDVVKFVVTPG